MESNKKKWIIIAVVCVVLAIIVYFSAINLSCNKDSNKIEVVSEPYLSYRSDGIRYSPIVKVTIKNKTDDTIKVELKCTVYANDGSVTTGLTSFITTLVGGETATLTATTSYTYSVFEYSEACASFGKVEYKFY